MGVRYEKSGREMSNDHQPVPTPRKKKGYELMHELFFGAIKMSTTCMQ